MKSTYLQSTAKKDRSGIVFFYTHVSVCVAQKSLCVSAPAQKHKPSHSPGNRLYVEADSFTLPFLEFSGQTEKVEVVVEWPSGNTLNVCMRCIVAWSPEELQEQTSATVQHGKVRLAYVRSKQRCLSGSCLLFYEGFISLQHTELLLEPRRSLQKRLC